ncbi:tonB-linked outer membrane protein SusC/RagA family [Alistipes sp. CAG:435]|jgi:TonB-linked SusC/RagA family outer membrane protein|nr:tonB-linked outer membrane protein SusC/RagA family [Alistipes sp. CAG:435]
MHDRNQKVASCLSRVKEAIVAVLLLMVVGTGTALAQTSGRTITGKVLDENNQPMPGVTIIVDGTTNGTMTGSDGTFTLGGVPSGATVIVSCIGYTNQVLPEGKSNYVVSLVPDSEMLEETVVVAFGQQKKLSVTGAISTVASADLRKTTSTRLDNALAGRVTGLTSMQSGGGQPGVDGATMYLRGAATTNGKSPLILVDGVERDNIRTIDMNEVESISVLKDASATALYGVQGANGVILIQTRKGQKGKAQLNISVDQGWTSFTKEPSRLHSWEYCELRNEALMNSGEKAAFSDETIAKFRNPLLGLDPSSPDYDNQVAIRKAVYCDNDYYRMYLKSNTPQTRANANISGGTDFVNYFVNVGYIHQGGNLNTESPDYLGYDPQCYMNRLSLRSNLDFHITKNLTASLNIASYAENVNMPAVGDLYRGDQSWMITDLIYQCQTILPISPGPTTDSRFGVESGGIVGYNYLDRSAFEIINRRGFHTNKRKNLNTQFSVNWDLSELVTKGLSINGMAAYDTYNIGVLEGRKKEQVYNVRVDYDSETLSYSSNGDKIEPLTMTSSRLSNYQIYVQGSINYARTFGKHNVTAMATAYRRFWEGTSANIPYNVLGTAARATYSFDDRYLVEGNLGYNGSEQFAPSKRFGLFPSGSIGWIASNESFLKGNKYLTWLKFRASYGLVGNDSMGGLRFLYQDDNQIQSGNGFVQGLGGKIVKEGLIGNKNITWELSKKMNLGVEIGLFKDFRINVDYFTEKRDQILLRRRTVPSFQGVSSDYIPRVNMGKVDNHGVDVEVSYSHTFNRDFSISSRVNFGFNDNTVIELDEPMRSEEYAYQYHEEGFRLGQEFGYLIDWNSPGNGYFTSQDEIDNYYPYEFGGKPRVGDFVYKDVNGDGVIDQKDLSPIGYSTTVPGLNYGISLGLNFKGIDFNVLFSGLGRYSKYYSGQGVVEWTKQGTYFDWTRNGWTEERYKNGEKITYPAISTSQTVSHTENDFFIQNRSFLRLKNIELGYTLPERFLSKVGVKALRVYVSGQNLFVWDNLRITHIDPEQNNSYGYPITKNVTLGLNINF